MAAAMRALNIKRGHMKAQLTNYKKFVDIFNSNEVKNFAQLKVRQDRNTNLLDNYENYHLESLEQVDETDVDTINQLTLEFANFQENYFDVTGQVRALLDENEKATSLTDALGSRAGSVVSHNNSQIKLPIIKIPIFNGAYEEWLYFYDTFDSLIHADNSLTDIQKFHYLRSSLTGTAAQVIQSLEISGDNYNEAWKLLKERFDNKKFLTRLHLKALLESPSIGKDSKLTIRQFLDDIIKHTRSLKALGQPIDTWDTILIFELSKKLDFNSLRDWETVSSKIDTEPTFKDFTKFLTTRSQLIETIESAKVRKDISHSQTPTSKNSTSNNTRTFANTNNNINSNATTKRNIQYVCYYCKQQHSIFSCQAFLNLTPTDRYNEVKRLQLCTNCLKSNHTRSNCKSSNCQRCNQQHHTLLHFDIASSSQSKDETSQSNLTVATHVNMHTKQVLLPTALVEIITNSGKVKTVRALLDSGGMSNFITEAVCKDLNLQCQSINHTISMVEQIKTKISKSTTVTFKSLFNNFSRSISCLVTKTITDTIPCLPFKMDAIQIPNNIKLADPNFNQPGKIDFLIGNEVFFALMCAGQIRTHINQPILQKTVLGWIVNGPITTSTHYQPQSSTSSLITNVQLHEQMQQFWELEEYENNKRKPSKQDEQCEEHFKHNYKLENGRFSVALPFHTNPSTLGDSREQALKRLTGVERKLNKNALMKTEYGQFMLEYEQLAHMTVLPNTTDINNSFYLPHHCVLRDSSLTTKLRVVFDGSAKSTTGVSINDLLMIGPTIQSDLISIILRFRLHPYVITADITKMYRQILVHESDRDFQRILWRENLTDEIKTYTLNTVTYGLSCAPFLAIRCLTQLGLNAIDTYPTTSNVILKDFYVDDVLTGSESIEGCEQIKRELTTILESGGFELRKWASNYNNNPNDSLSVDKSNQTLTFTDGQELKTLGIFWCPTSDILQYSTNLEANSNYNSKRITKRTVLSVISKIFDPLGLIGPISIKAKILMQKLWQLKLNWDESLPISFYTEWTRFLERLAAIKNIKIPRLTVLPNYERLELHAFCDASSMAYGACIYFRSCYSSDTQVSLITAKSRVAPLKTISVPRLELCGALLMAKLVNKVLKTVNIHFHAIFYWCDSTIVLSWIKTEPNLLKTFVSNRVSEIQTSTNPDNWQHVMSDDNPADIISRGIEPDQLSLSDKWWHGPSWLSESILSYPKHNLNNKTEIEIPELRNNTHTMTQLRTEPWNIFELYSSFIKLQRITANVFRFLHNVQQKDKQTGFITTDELKHATFILLKLMQQTCFHDDLKSLQRNKSVHTQSRLFRLNPFLDKDGLIRVGGRIKHANIDYDHKHPIVLDSKHSLTKLIIIHEHNKLLHAGAQTVLSSVRLRYWPIAGYSLVKRIIHDCLKCFRAKPPGLEYLMGDLPTSRVSPTRPFLVSGVDYAGPFNVKEGRGRGKRSVKAYLCVFVCLSTKAVHLEVASNLTTEAFLSAFKRFISRRGKPSTIYCDNGTNFVGAKNELAQLLNSNQYSKQIHDYLAQDMINWKFIPPRAPNFGGLWEAAVKSAKSHLKRILLNANLTFEELCTVVIQVEACLNSRPLTPLSSDSNDLNPLTPGHFLIGDSLHAIPQSDLTEIKEMRLSRFERCQKLVQHFWTRWHKEYLSQLQVRGKWNSPHSNINLKIGAMVLLREDNTPPQQWHLGRIIELHPGDDGVIRVVTVKTQRQQVKRAVSKISVLPID